MKAKIAHNNITRFNPEFDREKYRSLPGSLQRRLYLRKTPRTILHPLGDIVDHPEAYKLVELGMATPDDEECREAVGLSDEKIQHRIALYRKLSRGMATGKKLYDAEPEETEMDEEFNNLLEEEDDIVSTD